MNNSTYKILLLNLVVFLISMGKLWSQDCYSLLEIRTSGDGVLIFLENEFLGMDSVDVELSEGAYELLLFQGERDWDSKYIRDTVYIDGCDSFYTVTKVLPEKIYLDTNPSNAYVYQKDTLIGSTPLFLHKKFLSLRLEKPDFETKEITFQDQNSTLRHTLKYVGNTENEKFLDSPWFKVLFGSAVIFGSAAAYYKIKADNEFDIYRQNGNKSNLDTVEKYDLYSGIAFGLLQVNFAALLYFFLTD